MLGHDVQFVCAGRTDTGVHAWGQVVSCAVAPSTDPAVVQRAVNGHLAPEVVVRSAEVVEADFDAAAFRAVAQVPVHDRQPRRARSVPRPVRVVGAGAARPREDAPGVRPVSGGARLLELLPQGAEGLHRGAPGLRVGLARRGRRCVGVRDPRQRRSAGRWCGRSSGRSRTWASARSGRVTSWPSCARVTVRAAGRVAPPSGLCLWDVGYDVATVTS